MSNQRLKSTTIVDDTVVDISNNKIGENVESPIEAPTVKVADAGENIQFWTNDPNILFDSKYIFEYFPVEKMTYEQKLNAVSRTIIMLTVVGFIFSKIIRILFVGGISLFATFLMFYYHNKENFKSMGGFAAQGKEGFDNPANAVLSDLNIPVNRDGVFMPPSSNNPFSNVLMTDYDYNPNKKPAPPAFNKNVTDDINRETKKLIGEINQDQPDITEKLYKDLGEQLQFEQSMRQFNSTPNTTIPNDQTSFAEFCYGSMISCKEGNLFACARNKSNYSIY